MRQVQHGVTQQHQQLFVLSAEESRQRLLSRFDHDSFPHPLPKLRLCSPELFPIAANDQRCLLLAFLLHVDTPLPLRVEFRKALHTETPWGSLSCEAATNCQTGRRTPTPETSRAYLFDGCLTRLLEVSMRSWICS